MRLHTHIGWWEYTTTTDKIKKSINPCSASQTKPSQMLIVQHDQMWDIGKKMLLVCPNIAIPGFLHWHCWESGSRQAHLLSQLNLLVLVQCEKRTAVQCFNHFCLYYDFGIIRWPHILRNFQDLIVVSSFPVTVCWPRHGSQFSAVKGDGNSDLYREHPKAEHSF